MEIHKSTLQNGLRVLTIPMPQVESATVQILVGAGTRHEEKRVNGLAHFLEHMVFKGTRKYPTAQAISFAVDSIGGEINANTGKDRTAYYIKAWQKYLPLAFDILSEFVKAPILDPAEIEREKGVILEEIALYNDLPNRKVPSLFEELIFEDSSLGWEILGTKQTIPRVSQGDFANFRQKLYQPANMVLSIAGNFKRKDALKLAENYFGEPPKEKANPPVDGGNSSQNPQGKPELKLLHKKTEQAHLVLGVRGNPLGHKDKYKEEVVAAILGAGMSSRLFLEIRERRGLAYYVRTEVSRYKDAGYLATAAGVKVEKVPEAIKVLVSEYAKLRQKGQVSRVELEKAKEFLKGNLALALEDTHAVADLFGDQLLLEGKVRPFAEIKRGIDVVGASDVAEVAQKFFQNSRLNLAIIGPYNDPEKFGKLLKL